MQWRVAAPYIIAAFTSFLSCIGLTWAETPDTVKQGATAAASDCKSPSLQDQAEKKLVAAIQFFIKRQNSVEAERILAMLKECPGIPLPVRNFRVASGPAGGLNFIELQEALASFEAQRDTKQLPSSPSTRLGDLNNSAHQNTLNNSIRLNETIRSNEIIRSQGTLNNNSIGR